MMQEKQLRAWRAEFEHLHESIADCFGRREPRERARAYLQGLLAPLERKNGWHLAEAAGDRSPDGMQDFLARMHWDADAVRDALRDYVVAHLGAPDAVLVLDETGFIKKGEHSAGVQRQYSGTAGRIENCQVAVFLAYASERGYALIDRELYLPESWTQDTQRRRAAHIPDTVTLRTKPQIGREMLERALAAAIPFAWVTADSVYGSTWWLRQAIAEAGRGYVLAVLSSQQWSWPRQSVADIADALPQASWVALSCGAGAKGPRWYEWAYLPASPEAGFVRGLLVRRHRRRHAERAYYFTHAPVGTPLEKLVEVAGCRWTIETFHKILKSGCKVEQSKLRTAARLVNLIAICCILSWRLFLMTMINRLASERASPALAFTVTETALLDRLVKDKRNTDNKGKNLSCYLIKLACLGGYLARASDPPPGNIVMWRGLTRLMDIELGFEIARKCG